MPKPGLQAAFSLIELLIVITIIAILAALLMPAIALVRDQARQLTCLSNQRQCTMAALAYAAENGDDLPSRGAGVWFSPDNFCNPGSWDIRPLFAPYLGTFKAWRCGAFPKVPPIDDPGNTRWAQYGSLFYYPGSSCVIYAPFLAPGKYYAPDRLVNVINPSRVPIMQDNVGMAYPASISGDWIFYNHGSGTLYSLAYAGNPSNVHYMSDTALKYRFCTGANIAYYDGRAQWAPMATLQPIGTYAGTGEILSLR